MGPNTHRRTCRSDARPARLHAEAPHRRTLRGRGPRPWLLGWLTAALWLGAGAVEAQSDERPLRAVVLPSFAGEARERLQGQTADLRWTLVETQGAGASAADLCRAHNAQAALWLETSHDSHVTLWVYDAARDQSRARPFPLQPPGDAQARSAQLEALALSARSSLKVIAAQRSAAAPAPTPPSVPPPPPPPRRRPPARRPPPPSTPAPAEPESEVEEEVPPPPPEETVPAPVPPVPTAAVELEPEQTAPAPSSRGRVTWDLAAGYAPVHVGPLPWQHGPFASAGLGPARWPLRVRVGFERGFPVGLSAGEARLRLGRWALWAQVAAPFPWTAYLRAGPAVEVGWLRWTRRTVDVGGGLATTPAASHDLLSLRGLAQADVRLAQRRTLVLWLTFGAGIEVTPAQLKLRVEEGSGNVDVRLHRTSPTLRLGLRCSFGPPGDAPSEFLRPAVTRTDGRQPL